MKKFRNMATLFALPLVFGPIALVLIMPLRAFYYRPFEALLVYRLTTVLPGPFYPNMEIEMIEQGELGYHSRYAVPHQTRWVTDRYGQRTPNTEDEYDVVVVGDSFVVGAGVTQDKTLAPVLAARLHRRVYPYYQNENKLFDERRFRDHPPRIIVIASVESKVLGLDLPNPDTAAPRSPPITNRRLLAIGAGIDRWLKIDFLRYARAGTQRAALNALTGASTTLPDSAVPAKDGTMLFARHDAEPHHPIEPFISQAKAAHQALRKRGIRLIILPIPNKSTIYYDRRDGFVKTDFLERLGEGLRAAGIEAVTVEQAYREEADRGNLVFLADDTHWNELGIGIAAELLARQIRTDIGP